MSDQMPDQRPDLPLLSHPLEEASAFKASSLMEDVRRRRAIPDGAVAPLCVLEFDGDVTDWLAANGLATPFSLWPCFHTTMYALELEGITCGIVARTIGGPYAVLIAEQSAAAGARVIIALTSAGRVSSELPLPCLVAVTGAVRDEGTSLHYLPPGREVACPVNIAPMLAEELEATGWAVRVGKVWTTDAPYRETRSQLQQWAIEGVLAVEMHAASLFAFGTARGVTIGAVAMVSNAVDHEGSQFDTGGEDDGLRILRAYARAAQRFLGTVG